MTASFVKLKRSLLQHSSYGGFLLLPVQNAQGNLNELLVRRCPISANMPKEWRNHSLRRRVVHY